MGLTVLLFLVVFFVFAFGAVLYHPIMGVMGYIFVYLGLTRSSWWGETLLDLPLRYSFLMSICLITGFFIHRAKLAWMPSESLRRELLFWLFFSIIIFSYILAPIRPEDSWFTLINIVKVGIFLFFFSRIVTDLRSFRWIVKVLCLFGLLLGWNAYNAPDWMFVTGRLDDLGNADYTNANTLASLLSMLLCFAGLQVFQERKWSMRFLWMLCAAFITNGIILCQSRGFFLAIAFTAFFAFLAIPRTSPNLKRNLLIGMFLGACLFFYLTDPHFIDRVTAFDEYGEEASSASRLEIWGASIALFADYPLGVGVGNFKEHIGQYNHFVSGRDAHNTIVRCYSELGMHGLMVFMALYLSAFSQLNRIKRKIRTTRIEYEVSLYAFALFCALCITFIAGLFSTVLYIEFFWWLLVLPICLERSVDFELWEEKNHDKNLA